EILALLRLAEGASLTPSPSCDRLKPALPYLSEFPGAEGIALGHVAGFKAAAEPAHALRRGAVGERVGDHVPLRLLLETVVADGGGRTEGALEITRLEDV